MQIFNYSEEYVDEFKKKCRITPELLLKEWKDVLIAVYEGFNDFWTELDYIINLSYRDEIEPILFNKEILEYPEHESFLKELKKLDNLFMKITVENPNYNYNIHWTYNRVLKYAGEYYSKYYTNIEIKPIEDIEKDLAKEKAEVMSWDV